MTDPEEDNDKIINDNKVLEEANRILIKEKIRNLLKKKLVYKSIKLILFSKHNVDNKKYENLNITKMIYNKKTHAISKYNEKIIDSDNEEYLKRHLFQ